LLTKPQPEQTWQARMAAYGRSAGVALRHDLGATPTWLRWLIGAWLLLVVAVIVFLLVFDWNWLRGPASRFASAQLHREVRIDGNLRVHPWSFKPRAEIEGLKIGQPDWARQAAGQPAQMASVDRVAVQIRLLPLLRGQVILPQLEIDRPNVALLRQADGRANWTFGDPNKTSAKPFKLPAIQHFVIDDGQLRYDDRVREMTFTGHVTSNERATGDGRGRFELKGDGTLNGGKFLATVTGGPLLNISPSRPYPITADIQAGTTFVKASGQIDKPFDLGRFGATLDLRGADLNNLYYLTGLSLPNTPPYTIRGSLRRDDKTWTFDRFAGRVGESDVNGDLKVQTGGARPLLTGAVRSRRLDFNDLGSIVGMSPAVARGSTQKVASSDKANAIANANGGHLLPDSTLQVERIRAMDAKVTYRAATVNAPGLPLRKVSIDVDLNNGVLDLDPLSFSFSRGDLSGKVRLDARGATPRTDADLRLVNAKLEDFVPIKNPSGQPAIEGAVAARARLSGAGNSVHKAAAASNGDVTLVIPRGEIRQAFAELLGINASKGLLLLLSKDTHETPLRCAVANFKVENGVMRAQQIVIDTGVVLASGSGTINLGDETMDLRITGDSKKPRLVRLFAPITLKGQLTKPSVGVETSKLVAQGGLGLALGSLLSPLATILPFVDAGLAKDADCMSLMQEAKASPASAPVAVASTTPAKVKK
jgi:uncharacterized protein involved in outer membrane biogenesis